MLVEPGVDPSAGFRAGRRTGRVPPKGPRLEREGKAVAAGQADGTAPPGRAAASGTDGAGPTRIDHDAVLSPNPALAVGQASGPPSDAGRDAPQPSRRLRRRRPRASSPGGRVPRNTLRPEAPRPMALGRFGLPGHDSRRGRNGHPVDRHGRGNPLLLDRRLGLARSERLPPQSRDALPPLARKSRASRCKSSSATTP